MQTFSLIQIDNVQILPEKIMIKIPDIIKTSGPNKLQPLLVLPFFPENCKVCAANTLVSYIDRTKKLRGSEKTLFISFHDYR